MVDSRTPTFAVREAALAGSILSIAVAGAAIGFTNSPLLVAAAISFAVGMIVLVRSNPTVWLGVLVTVIAFDGVVKLNFWPSFWPQLLTPIVLVVAYVTCLTRPDRVRWLNVAALPFTAMGAVLILGLLSMLVNGRSSPLMGAVGLYTWVAFAPLAWVGSVVLNNSDRLEKAIRWTLLLAVPIAATAAIQFVLGPSWYASLGPGFAQATFGVAGFSGEGVFRANGTFSAPGHLSGFMIPLTFFAIAALVAGDARSTRAAGAVGLMASLVALFANSQRSWALILIVGVPLLFALTRSTVPPGRWIRLGGYVLAGLLVGSVIAGPALADRLLTIANDPIDVIVGSTLGEFGILRVASAMETGGILGHGPGTATIGARYFGQIWESTESYVANAFYELGPLGFFAIIATILAVPTITFRAWRQETDRFVRTVLAALLTYQAAVIALSITYSPLAYPPAALFFWVGTGVAATRLTPALSPVGDGADFPRIVRNPPAGVLAGPPLGRSR